MVGGKFKASLSERSRVNDSKLILALDVPNDTIKGRKPEQECLNILNRTSNQIAAVKIGYSLVLKAGLGTISKIKKIHHLPIIADFKIADVPHISEQIARYAYKSGAEGVITHGFMGRDSLEAIIEVAREEGDKGVIVVSSMSHPGGRMFICPHSNQILKLAKETGATGVIAPATRPEEVAALRSKAGEEMLILTPGIGAQGARPGDAIRSGADYEIVGRTIYTSKTPQMVAERIRNTINRTLKRR